jgi:hypothetical protein
VTPIARMLPEVATAGVADGCQVGGSRQREARFLRLGMPRNRGRGMIPPMPRFTQRLSWGPIGRVPVGKVAFELFSVFLAVTGALVANAWWQGRQAAAAGRTALVALAAEIRTNSHEVEARVDHHRSIVGKAQELLASMAKGGEAPRDVMALRTALTGGKGMRTPVLSRAAWDSAVAAGLLAEVPLASTQRIAGVYELQRKLDRVIDQTIVNLTVATSFDFERPGPMLTAQMVTASMIVELEVDYVASCQACLELLGG